MSKLILCIEDNPQNMRLVHKILAGAGYTVAEAFDGLSGFQVVKELKPQLILIDLNLPDIDGLEVTALIKARPDLRTIPVIALTANAMHGDRERCLAAGCDGYIPKPIMKHELLTAVAHFIEASAANV